MYEIKASLSFQVPTLKLMEPMSARERSVPPPQLLAEVFHQGPGRLSDQKDYLAQKASLATEDKF
jgi:hypothetical protein